MPYTLNGVGTWYYGKADPYQRFGICEHCGQETTLHSYDTTRYFVFLFIPLIPLGKMHILDECKACRRHSRIPLKKWQKAKSQALAEKRAEMDRDPDNQEPAIALLGMQAGFHEVDDFWELAPQLAQRFSQTPKVLNAIADIYAGFGYLDEAENHFNASLAVQDDPLIHEQLALLLIKKYQPEAAESHLAHIDERAEPEKAAFLIQLAKSYQSVGDHQNALRILEQAATVALELKNDKGYAKLVKLSQRHAQTGKQIRYADIQAPEGPVGSGADISGVTARAVMIGILVLAFLGYWIAAWQKGRNREAIFVNGLSQRYDVVVNDQTHSLPPGSYKRIPIGEGEIHIAAAGTDLPIEPQTLHVETAFWSRPFRNPVFVVNPDHVGIILWGKTWYAVHPDDAPKGEARVYYGDAFYSFNHVDYPFNTMPDQLDLPNGKPLAKTYLEVVDASESIYQLLAYLNYQQDNADKLADYLIRRMRYDPGNTDYPQLLMTVADSDRFLEAIRPGLSERPVRIEWHRLYQNYMEENRPEVNLVPEYQSYLQREPANTALMYLLGRVLKDPEEAEEYFRQAVSGDPPCPHGYLALTYQKLSVAEFDQALSYSEQAVQADPENLPFQYYYRESLEATGQFDRAIAEYRKDRKDEFAPLATIVPQARLILRKAGYPAAKEWLNKALADQRGDSDPENAADTARRAESTLALYANDMDRFAQLQNENDKESRIQVALSRGKPVDPHWLDNVQEADPYLILTLYIVEMHEEHSDQAAQYLQRVGEMLEKPRYEERLLLAMLNGKKPFDLQLALAVPLTCEVKRLYLTALGLRYPDQHRALFDLAEKLNFSLDFPHWVLQNIFDS